jgi:tetrahydromethanopterin S-methyltransferase subunit G
MHLMRESWTDARLDDFRLDVDRRFDEVDRRFDKVDKRFDKVEGEIGELRSEMKSGFDSINRTMVHGVVALSASFIAGFAAIVTQL